MAEKDNDSDPVVNDDMTISRATFQMMIQSQNLALMEYSKLTTELAEIRSLLYQRLATPQAIPMTAASPPPGGSPGLRPVQQQNPPRPTQGSPTPPAQVSRG